MKLVVGLGNPGPDYEGTRHNVGFDAVDRVATRRRFGAAERRYKGWVLEGRLGPEPVVLLKPATYMNLSGEAVKAAMSHLGTESADLLVVHDEIDFELGTVRVKRGGGDAGHRGIQSIIQELGRSDFARIRIGVGRPAHRGGVVDWVLERFDEDENETLESAIDLACDAIEVWSRRGPGVAMNQINRKIKNRTASEVSPSHGTEPTKEE